MAQLVVTSTQLRQKAQTLRTLNNLFKNAIGKLSDSERTVAGMWEGEAQQEFRRVFNKDYLQFEAFYKGINEYIQTLENAAKEYDATEARNVQLAKKHP